MLNKGFVLFLIALFALTGCSSSLTNSQSNRAVPDKTLMIFIDALNKKNGETIYKLLAPGDKKVIEENIKTYLTTINELNNEEETEKIMKLRGQEFFIAFVSSKYYHQNKKIEPLIAEIKMLNNNSIADMKLIINEITTSIKLVKQGKIWYVSVDNLISN